MNQGIKVGSTTDQIYQYIVSYTKKNLYPPSIREIATFTGLKSSSSVFNHLKKLEDANLIVCKENCSRALKLMGYELVKKDEILRSNSN